TVFSLMIRTPTGAPPFPYTTLFRSSAVTRVGHGPTPRGRSEGAGAAMQRIARPGKGRDAFLLHAIHRRNRLDELTLLAKRRIARSEEHTSELQSLAYLVCRLLLEKK